MKKPVVIVIIGGLLLGCLGAGAYVYVSQKTSATVEVTGANVTPTPAMTLLTWDDPSGFTMKYPDTVTVNKHDEDQVNYAHVELSNPAHPGGIIVWVKDLPKNVTNTLSWGKMAATPSSAISFDTTLGGQPAQKILVSGAVKQQSVGIVYDGVVWSIEAALADEPYWQQVYDVITKSFAFKPLSGSDSAAESQPASSGGGAAAPAADTSSSVDEEEVLE